MDYSLLSNYIEPRLFIAAGLGAAIGLERELAGKDPSFRTFALICLGSCIFSMISDTIALPASDSMHLITSGTPPRYFSDPGRIAAQIVVGIGFIGAGTIFRSRAGINGLTTAALMWVTAAIGMAVGFNKLELAISGTITSILTLSVLSYLHRLLHYLRTRSNKNSSS